MFTATESKIMEVLQFVVAPLSCICNNTTGGCFYNITTTQFVIVGIDLLDYMCGVFACNSLC